MPHSSSQPPQIYSPWPHRLAVALLCAAFPLIWVGGLVTTYRAGMAVPDWPNTYGYNLFLYPWTTWVAGPWDLFIEHGHRLLGALVGLLTIALVAEIWRNDARRWLRWLAALALALVVLQGVLGGLRVVLDRVLLAKIHGCTGPAFFALATALAVFTSRTWHVRRPVEHAAAGRGQRLAVGLAVLAYVQLLIGAEMRHLSAGMAPADFRTALVFHIILAAALVVNAAWLVGVTIVHWSANRELLRPAIALTVLLFVQLALGACTWLAKYGWPNWLDPWSLAAGYVVQAEGFAASLLATAHVANGSLILAVSVVAALRTCAWLRQPIGRRASLRLLEVAA